MRSQTRRHTGPRLRPVVAVAGVILLLSSPSARGATRWSQTYGGPAGNEGPLDLRELPDHSIVIAGHTDSFGTRTGDAWWLHIDGDGRLLDQRVYGNALPGGAAGAAIDPDGGMVVVGAHTLDLFTDRDAWAHHVGRSGVIDWEWGFDADPGLHSFLAVAATTGGYIAVGSTAISTSPPIHAWAVSLDHSGNVIWQQRYNGGVAEVADLVVQTLDGGYAIAGWSTSSGAGSRDLWLLKVSGTGTIQWQKTYGGADQEEATGLIQTADGGYAVSAFTNTFAASGHAAWLLRLDGSGNVVWQKVMGDAEWSDFHNVLRTRDGNLICTGRISGPSSNDLWVVKFRDSDGAVLWQRAYEGTEGDWGSQTIELDDNDLLIGGVWAWGFPEEDIWIQRTDPSGLIPGCSLIHDTAVAARAPAITVRNAIAVASTPEPAPEALDFVADTSAATVGEKCRDTAGVEPPGSIAIPPGSLCVAPNPIRTSALITFQLGEEARASIGIFDLHGRRIDSIAEATYSAGRHELVWAPHEGRMPPAGVYYLVLDAGKAPLVRRTIIIR